MIILLHLPPVFYRALIVLMLGSIEFGVPDYESFDRSSAAVITMGSAVGSRPSTLTTTCPTPTTTTGPAWHTPSDLNYISNITLDQDLAVRQNITQNYNHSAGRCAHVCEHPNVGVEVDRVWGCMPVKRLGNVYGILCSDETLNEAAKIACKSRWESVYHRQEVLDFKSNKEENLAILKNMLVSMEFQSSEYSTWITNERGKDRLVADVPLNPDRIVHNAISLVIEDFLDNRFIDQTYGSRKGKGHHAAVVRVKLYLYEDYRVRYALILDVKKFYESMSKEILKSDLRRFIKDERLLTILDRIIDGYPLSGIPKGTRLSPLFANLYLNDLDHLLKEKYHVHKIVRYLDDYAILGYSKEWLKKILNVIEEELGKKGLTVKENVRIVEIDRDGIPFLGFVIRRDYTLLKKNTKLRMKKGASAILKSLDDPYYVLSEKDMSRIRAYLGNLSWCDGRHLAKVTFDPIFDADRRNRERKETENETDKE